VNGADIMSRLCAGLLAVAQLLIFSATCLAQTKELRGRTVTVTATVAAIAPTTRTLTLRPPEGDELAVVAAKSDTGFSGIKVGDQITATYYQNVVLRVKKPGERAADSDSRVPSASGAAKPGVRPPTQRTITATITAIDLAVPSISFSGPNNWTYSAAVEDSTALRTVKVGERVDIMWTVPLLVSFVQVGK
jgi:hypothetical protein